jgi:hypothetical protein
VFRIFSYDFQALEGGDNELLRMVLGLLYVSLPLLILLKSVIISFRDGIDPMPTRGEVLLQHLARHLPLSWMEIYNGIYPAPLMEKFRRFHETAARFGRRMLTEEMTAGPNAGEGNNVLSKLGKYLQKALWIIKN